MKLFKKEHVGRFNCYVQLDKVHLLAFLNRSSNFCINVIWRFFGWQIACPWATALTRYKIVKPLAQSQYFRDSMAKWESRCPFGKYKSRLRCRLKPYQITPYRSLLSPLRAFLMELRSSAIWKDDGECTAFPGLSSRGQRLHNMSDWLWKRWFRSFLKDFLIYLWHKDECLFLPRLFRRSGMWSGVVHRKELISFHYNELKFSQDRRRLFFYLHIQIIYLNSLSF